MNEGIKLTSFSHGAAVADANYHQKYWLRY
jgi:hypothetical protein